MSEKELKKYRKKERKKKNKKILFILKNSEKEAYKRKKKEGIIDFTNWNEETKIMKKYLDVYYFKSDGGFIFEILKDFYSDKLYLASIETQTGEIKTFYYEEILKEIIQRILGIFSSGLLKTLKDEEKTPPFLNSLLENALNNVNWHNLVNYAIENSEFEKEYWQEE